MLVQNKTKMVSFNKPIAHWSEPTQLLSEMHVLPDQQPLVRQNSQARSEASLRNAEVSVKPSIVPAQPNIISTA